MSRFVVQFVVLALPGRVRLLQRKQRFNAVLPGRVGNLRLLRQRVLRRRAGMPKRPVRGSDIRPGWRCRR